MLFRSNDTATTEIYTGPYTLSLHDALSDLNLRRIRLLTNHPRKVAALEGFGIEIIEQVPISLSSAKVKQST